MSRERIVSVQRNAGFQKDDGITQSGCLSADERIEQQEFVKALDVILLIDSTARKILAREK